MSHGSAICEGCTIHMDGNVYPVLIVEDHGHTAERLARSVDGHDSLSCCAVAHTLRDGLRMLKQHKPRVILTDLGLPDGDGKDIIRAAGKADWECDCLVISVFGDEARVLGAIRSGARGYILKDSSDHDIAVDILSVISGGSPISPKIARHLLSVVAPEPVAAETGPTSGSAMYLTPRETEILNAIAKGYKRHEIASALVISPGTVGNHINNIYKKLEVSSSTEALAEASQLGLV